MGLYEIAMDVYLQRCKEQDKTVQTVKFEKRNDGTVVPFVTIERNEEQGDAE